MVDVENIQLHLAALWTQAAALWRSGGWAMSAIAATALVLYGMGINLFFRLRAQGSTSVQEGLWRRWVDHPNERRGRLGRLIDALTTGATLEESALAFARFNESQTVPYARDLRLMKICVGVAPLIGLLGTVTGMLATFGALSSGPGGSKTMGLVAEGISEALITTETGLVIALPGLLFQYHIGRKFEQYRAFLAHVQTVCTQTLYTRLRTKALIRETAQAHIARALRKTLKEHPVTS